MRACWGVHVDCIAAGAPRYHVFLNPTKSLPIPTNYDADMTRSESAGHTRRHAVAPASCRFLYIALAKALISLPPSGSSGCGGRAVSGSWFGEPVCVAYRPRLTSLPNFCWVFLGVGGDRIMRC